MGDTSNSHGAFGFLECTRITASRTWIAMAIVASLLCGACDNGTPDTSPKERGKGENDSTYHDSEANKDHAFSSAHSRAPGSDAEQPVRYCRTTGSDYSHARV